MAKTIEPATPADLVETAKEVARQIRVLMRSDITKARETLDQLENENPTLFALVSPEVW